MSPTPPFCSGPGRAMTSTSCMSCAAGNPPARTSSATQAPTTTAPGSPAKSPHGCPVNTRSPPSPEPRQRWKPELEEEPHSDTAVGTAAGSSEPLATLPKDNDDNGSEYVASSDEDQGPVPAKRRRVSTKPRPRGVRAPPLRQSRTPVSEGSAACHGRNCSHSRSEGSVAERTLPVASGRRRTRVPSKKLTESNAHVAQRHTPLTHKSAHRADGAGRTGTPSDVLSPDVVKSLRENSRMLSARPPRQEAVAVVPAVSRTPISAEGSQKRAAGSQQATTPEPVTDARSAEPPDDGSAAVKQFLSGIGLGQSHLQILLEEGIRTQQDLDDLQQMERESIVELRDVLKARGFTAFEFSKVEYAVSRREN